MISPYSTQITCRQFSEIIAGEKVRFYDKSTLDSADFMITE